LDYDQIKNRIQMKSHFSLYIARFCIFLELLLVSNGAKSQWVRVSPPSIGEFDASICSFGSSIFVRTDSDVFITSDDGLNWKPTFLRDSDGAGAEFASIGNAFFNAGLQGVYRSDDSGLSWYRADLGSTLGDPGGNTGLAVLGTRLFCASDWDGLLYSDNLGYTWYLALTNIGTSAFHNVQNVNGIIFAQGEGDVKFNHTGGVVRSSDRGNTWQLVALQNNVLSYGGIGDRVFFPGGDSSFYESDDAGLTWMARPEVLPDSDAFACFLTYNDIILGGCYLGLYVSLDSGTTWILKNDGIPSTAQGIVSLAIHDNYLFAGTVDSGVWRTSLSDFNPSVVAGNGATNFANILRVFPNPASGVLQIMSGQSGEVHLFDLMGRERMNATIIAGDSKSGSATLDISSLPPGMYFVSDGHSQTKFVKE
jgi:photosystem II stability/assembly factor-like uncharacterized protein